MMLSALLVLGFLAYPLKPGDHSRMVRSGDSDRPYLLHLPGGFDPEKPTPVVLALHPIATNGRMMAAITKLNDVADREGFIVAYPNGTGPAAFLRWNVGPGLGDADDVGYLLNVLDDIGTVARVDPRRVYAAGYSNGAMMCFRLAAEHPDRIAAIATVGGTMTDAGRPKELKRPVSVLHFHGTDDTLVPYQTPPPGPLARLGRERFPLMQSVEATVNAWAEADGCPGRPAREDIPSRPGDGLTIHRSTYGPGKGEAEVVLYQVVGGGHTWPGQPPPNPFLGKSPMDLKASEILWDFFEKHPIPERKAR